MKTPLCTHSQSYRSLQRQSHYLNLYKHRRRALLRGLKIPVCSLQKPVQTCWPAIITVASLLHSMKVAYMFRGATAALIQGADVEDPQLDVEIQWDALDMVRKALASSIGTVSDTSRHPGGLLTFSTGLHPQALASSGMPKIDDTDLLLRVQCVMSTVVAIKAERQAVPVPHWLPPALLAPAKADGFITSLWVQSLLSIREEAEQTQHPVNGKDQVRPHLANAVTARLCQIQEEMGANNSRAWNEELAGQAWLGRFGSLEKAAARVTTDPAAILGGLLPHLLPLEGAKVVNLLGSHATKAVALARLGAQVTVVDVSRANAEYAEQLAAAAQVQLRYMVSDVLTLPAAELDGSYDVVLMEMGVLHYFVDLRPLARVVAELLRPGGRLLLREFHPVPTKLLSSRGKKHKVTGNYFNSDLMEKEVAYLKYTETSPGSQDTELPAARRSKVMLRQWNLGEVISELARADLFTVFLDEESGACLDDLGIPKTFMLVARRV